MSLPPDMIERLGGLSRVDREWILARLSTEAKVGLARLAKRGPDTAPQLAASERSVPAESAGEFEQLWRDQKALNALDGAQVASVLAEEPLWLIALILKVRHWRWESLVLMRFPPATRMELSQLRSDLPDLSAPMANLLVQALRERLDAGGPHWGFLPDGVPGRAAESAR